MKEETLQIVSATFIAVLQAILLIVNIATLLKLLKGNNNRKAIQVVLWYFFSSFACITGYLFTVKSIEPGSSNQIVWLMIPAICISIFYCFESVGHFQFTFNYLKVVVMIPYIINQSLATELTKSYAAFGSLWSHTICLSVFCLNWLLHDLIL